MTALSTPIPAPPSQSVIDDELRRVVYLRRAAVRGETGADPFVLTAQIDRLLDIRPFCVALSMPSVPVNGWRAT